MEIKNEKDLLSLQLKALYNMEEQLIQALPVLAQKATNSDLKRALEHHIEMTKKQRLRIEKIGQDNEMALKGVSDEAMMHIIKSEQTLIQQITDPQLRDVAIMAGADKVEHYEMAAYQSAIVLAEKLEMDDTADSLSDSFDEEQQAADMIESLAQ